MKLQKNLDKTKFGLEKKSIYLVDKKGVEWRGKRGLCPPHHSTHYTLIPHTLNSTQQNQS